MSTHCRNIILKRRHIMAASIPAVAPGQVRDLIVVTPRTNNSGRATATWRSPEGALPGTLDYLPVLTGGVGTVTITSIVVS